MTTTAVSEHNFIRQALDFAMEEMRTLQLLKPNIKRPQATAELGTVVVTDKDTFFISVSIEEFISDGKHYMGISTKSPIFQEMREKSVFETFVHGKIQYFIKEIF